MARKRKNLRHLDYQSPAYWEGVLAEEHLTEGRGTTSKLSYVGTTIDLERIEAIAAEGNNYESL